MSIDEYKTLKQDCIDKQVRYIPLFICEPNKMVGLRTSRNFQRIYTFLTIYFASVSCLTSIPQMIPIVYPVTGLVTLLNGGIWYRSRQYYKTFTLNIEWDVDMEEFVIKLPKNTLGGVIEKRVKV